MVKLATIREDNARFAREQHAGQVCVFVGATTGIGMSTLRQLVTMLPSSTFYILGRDEAKFAQELQRLRSSGPTNKLVFIPAQVSQIASVDAACATIAAAEKQVDYLWLSPGGIPFEGAVYTPEGLEQSLAVSYYSRARMISNLMPQLRAAPRARIVSVLNGGQEQAINDVDPGLDRQWTAMGVLKHTPLFNSLAFDRLAANDPDHRLTLVHAAPGLVYTATPRRGSPSTKDGYFWWAVRSTLQVVAEWAYYLFGANLGESGERHAFLLTSDTYPRGSIRTDAANEVVEDNAVMRDYKARGWIDKVWEHTVQVWDRALAKAS